MDHSLKQLTRAAGLALGVFAVVAATAVMAGANGVVHPPSSCTAAQVEAAGKKAYHKLKCYERALSNGEAVSEECLRKAERRFSDSFSDGEKAGDCLLGGVQQVDESTIERKIDCMVEDVVCEVMGGSSCNLICSAF